LTATDRFDSFALLANPSIRSTKMAKCSIIKTIGNPETIDNDNDRFDVQLGD
jgi:6-phosphofructokinase